MGYIKKERHDIFVSYKHRESDHESMYLDNHGRHWTQAIVELLRKAVNRRLKSQDDNHDQRDSLDFWIAKELSGNISLTDQLSSHAGKSEFLLVFMSNEYIGSEWCGKERDWFLKGATSRQLPDERIFIARLEEIRDEHWPDSLRDNRGDQLLGFPFYDQATGKQFGRPTPDSSNSKAYLDERLESLADDIVDQILKTLSEADVEENSAPVKLTGNQAESTTKRIYLASVHSDLAKEREDLRLQLQKRGYSVVPEHNQTKVPKIMETFPIELAQCNQFIQLLDGADPAGAAEWQAEAAININIDSQFLLIDPESPDKVENEDYRNFLKSLPNLYTGRIESFLKTIQPSLARFQPAPRIFINSGIPDDNFLARLKETAVNEQFECHLLKGDTPSKNGEQRNSYTEDCDAIILINSKSAHTEWVRNQIALINRALNTGKNSSPPFVTIVQAPPPPPDEVFHPNIPIIDCTQTRPDETDSQFKEWLQALKGALPS